MAVPGVPAAVGGLVIPVRETATEPITAWRVYSIGDTGALRPLTMVSMNRAGTNFYDLALPDQEAWTYTIGNRYTANLDGRDLRHHPYWPITHDGRVSLGGFYARRHRADALWYLLTHVAPRQSPAFAIGPVLLEGTVVEGQLGYQAEQMTVLPPELVLVQENLETGGQVLSHKVCVNPIHRWSAPNDALDSRWHADWKGLRVISWTEWKKEKEAWILERSSGSLRLYPPPLRFPIPPQNPFLRNGGPVNRPVPLFPIEELGLN